MLCLKSRNSGCLRQTEQLAPARILESLDKLSNILSGSSKTTMGVSVKADAMKWAENFLTSFSIMLMIANTISPIFRFAG